MISKNSCTVSRISLFRCIPAIPCVTLQSKCVPQARRLTERHFFSLLCANRRGREPPPAWEQFQKTLGRPPQKGGEPRWGHLLSWLPTAIQWELYMCIKCAWIRGDIPEQQATSSVKLLDKKGSPSSVLNYRPICVSCMCTLFASLLLQAIQRWRRRACSPRRQGRSKSCEQSRRERSVLRAAYARVTGTFAGWTWDWRQKLARDSTILSSGRGTQGVYNQCPTESMGVSSAARHSTQYVCLPVVAKAFSTAPHASMLQALACIGTLLICSLQSQNLTANP